MTGKIDLGQSAFTGSFGWLVSTIGHEMVHYKQYKEEWYCFEIDRCHYAKDAEAWGWEYSVRHSLSMSESEIQRIEEKWDQYKRFLNTWEK